MNSLDSPRSYGRWFRWWVVGYVVLVGVVIGGMFGTRPWAIAQMSSAKSISDWRTWSEDVREEQSRRGVADRRIPKGDEPPALVLMRDHFAVLVVGALLFSSILYWVIAWFITGMMNSQKIAS